MKTDDDHRGKSEQGGDQSDPPTRDANGRWLKGHCPNPRGRPRKSPKENLDLSDLRIFGNTMIDVVANGEKEMMDRRAALLHKMYESALKGRVSMQRFLYQEFEKNAFRLAQARVRYDLLVTKFLIENPRLGQPGYVLPIAIKREIASLREMLEFYHPGEYRGPDLSEADDEEV